MARPVIGSRSGGINETILDAKTGFLVERNSVSGLEKAIRKLILNPSLAQNLGENGRQYVIEEFNGRTYVSRLLERYFTQ